MDKIIEVLKNPDIILIIIIILLLIGKIVFKMNYASTRLIFLNYLSCFRNKEGRLLPVPVFYYFVVPFLFDILILYYRRLDEDIVNILLIIVTILVTLFVTLLTTIIEMKTKIQRDANYYSREAEISNKAIIQSYYILMFEITLCVLILIICLLCIFLKQYGYLTSFLIYYLTTLVFINVFVFIKRFYNVIDQDIGK